LAMSDVALLLPGATAAAERPCKQSGRGVVGSASYCMAREETVIGFAFR
jgi:hypothetical protein